MRQPPEPTDGRGPPRPGDHGAGGDDRHGAPPSGDIGPRMGMIALAFLLTSVLLNFSTPLDFADAFLLGALLVLLPSMAVLQLSMLEDEPLEREAVYLGSGATILLLGGASFLTGIRRIGLDGMGLGRIDAGSFLLWTVGLTAAGFALMAAFHWVGLLLRIDETSMLEQLLPETPREKALFAGLSLCAGIGEELAYRAYAITTIALALTAFTASAPTGVAGGPDAAAAAARAAASGATEGAILWLSILVASGAFGFLHAYQGVIGILRTASLGFVLAVSFLMTGNLWPAVAAHTLIDLLVGLVLGKHILRYGRGNGD